MKTCQLQEANSQQVKALNSTQILQGPKAPIGLELLNIIVFIPWVFRKDFMCQPFRQRKSNFTNVGACQSSRHIAQHFVGRVLTCGEGGPTYESKFASLNVEVGMEPSSHLPNSSVA